MSKAFWHTCEIESNVSRFRMTKRCWLAARRFWKAISLNLLECVFDSAGGNQNLIGQQARYVFVLSECLTDLRRSNSAIFLSNDVRNRIDAWSHSLDVLRIKL